MVFVKAKTEFVESRKVRSRAITLAFPRVQWIVISTQFMCQSELRRERVLPESLMLQAFVLIDNHENHIPEIHKNAIN